MWHSNKILDCNPKDFYTFKGVVQEVFIVIIHSCFGHEIRLVDVLYDARREEDDLFGAV